MVRFVLDVVDVAVSDALWKKIVWEARGKTRQAAPPCFKRNR